jgi:hypothetical protein
MFNAKSTFMRNDVGITPQAIVLDDAHAGLEIIRQQFTLNVSGEAFNDLKKILKSSCSSYHKFTWKDIEDGVSNEYLDIPFWLWMSNIDDIASMLHTHSKSKDSPDSLDFAFAWPLISDILKYCRCVISGSHAEIMPEIMPINKIKPFFKCKHRLFMSATLADDSLLVKDLGVEINALNNLIVPVADRGIGERMILTPDLINPDMNRNYIMALSHKLSENFNVVVLTSSEYKAKEWVESGAKYYSAGDFINGVNELRDPNSEMRFAVFAQRYEGVDLADDACRVLIIDGLPFGSSNMDSLDAETLDVKGGVRNKIIYRIEQGMGRAVRSHADYAVILLVGSDIGSYIGYKEVQSALSKETVAQIKLSRKLCEAISINSKDPKSGFIEAILACLGRDEKWKKGYQSVMKGVTKESLPVDIKVVNLGLAQRQAYDFAYNNQPHKGVQNLSSLINDSAISDEERGFLLQKMARVIYSYNEVEAFNVQQAAKAKYRGAFTPPQMNNKIISVENLNNADNIVNYLSDLDDLNAAVLFIDHIINDLDFSISNSKIIEKSIRNIGVALGLTSIMPEHELGSGPDVAWLWDNFIFVIEVKHNNANTLHKKDSGQLHDSLKWATDNYPMMNIIPITVAKDHVFFADQDAHYPDGILLLNENGCKKILANLRNFYFQISANPSISISSQLINKNLDSMKLTRKSFKDNYTQTLKKKIS